MSKKILEELDKILKICEKFPSGAYVNEIKKKLDLSFSTRTLQRRLKRLERQKKIYSKGNGRAKKYYLLESPSFYKKHSKGTILEFSKEALKIKSKITKPIYKRPEVNYHQNFLNKYRPNITFYLSKDIRNR